QRSPPEPQPRTRLRRPDVPAPRGLHPNRGRRNAGGPHQGKRDLRGTRRNPEDHQQAHRRGGLQAPRRPIDHPAPGNQPGARTALTARLTPPGEPMHPTPTLIVLYTHHLEACHAFYTGLGADFAKEQHGTGPEHYAATLTGGLVLEIYPASDRRPPTGSLRLGLTVPTTRTLPPLTPGRHLL